MKRILRFVFIVAAMLAYYFAYTWLFSPILENILYDGVDTLNESSMLIFSLIMQAFGAVIFIFLYIKWYIAVPEHKREFLKHIEIDGYDIKNDIVYYIEENNGNIDFLIYVLYSVPLPLSLLFFGGESPITFLYFHQLIFYSMRITNIFIVNLAFSYMCSILIFIIGYIFGIMILHKTWYKKRLRR